MSYCRWSTDDFQCDLYIYADTRGGWTTHVAVYRPVFKEPLPPEIPFPDPNLWQRFLWWIATPFKYQGPTRPIRRFLSRIGFIGSDKRWFERHQKVMKMMDGVERKPIGLPYDGETFNDGSLEDLLDRLLHLRKTGYRFPISVIGSIIEEMEEEEMV